VTFRGPDPRRTLVPRWRASNEAANAGELTSVSAKTSRSVETITNSHFQRLRDEWLRGPSVEVGADLLSCGVALGLVEDREVQHAALLIEKSDVQGPLISIARRVLTGTIGRMADSKAISFDPEVARADLQSQIATHKRRVREYPRNAFAWADLARLYASSGQLAKAHDAINVSIILAPENRFVLRTAARFFVHAGGKIPQVSVDQGLRLLRKSRLLRQDPWLMAAEISLSTIAEDPTRILREARKLADADTLRPWDLSELNGALGTLAIEQGGLGKPSKHFTRSLRQPTENALAQAQWASDVHHAVTVLPQSFERWRAPPFEALALKHRAEGKWSEAIADCRAWSTMEPTSTRPLILGAFIAEVALEDGDIAREFSERALVLEPNAYWANNNLAVALAYNDKLDEAQRYANKFQPDSVSDNCRAAYWATLGLIEYRRGKREAGLGLYLKAADTEYAVKTPSVRATVIWHLLREEARIGAPGIESLADMMSKRTGFADVPELAALRERIANPKVSYRERAAALVRSVMSIDDVKSMRHRIESGLRLTPTPDPAPPEKS
jgi:tetratricopeptide (TPR) repeat protein